MEVFDKDGNPVEGVFSKEELEQELEKRIKEEYEVVEDEQPTGEEDGDTPPEEPPAVSTPEMPEWAKQMKEQLDALNSNQTATVLDKYTSGLDADKVDDFKAKYDNLQGYDNSPEGMQRRAEDAYLLATGERYDSSSVNMQNIAASSGGAANISESNTKFTAQDKEIQKALGITEEDVEKYGK